MYNILLACDSQYYNDWAIDCIKSIQHHTPWINITVFIVNPYNITELPNVRYAYESINLSKSSEIGYYQAVRFLKCAELFPNNELVMSIDCDTVLTRDFSESEFQKICSNVTVQRHQKDIRWMAGLVTFGNDNNFRNRFKEELLTKPISEWTYGWDQDVLENLSAEFNYKKVMVGDWMSFGKGRGIFLTLKGDQKILEDYLTAYKNFLKN